MCKRMNHNLPKGKGERKSEEFRSLFLKIVQYIIFNHLKTHNFWRYFLLWLVLRSNHFAAIDQLFLLVIITKQIDDFTTRWWKLKQYGIKVIVDRIALHVIPVSRNHVRQMFHATFRVFLAYRIQTMVEFEIYHHKNVIRNRKEYENVIFIAKYAVMALKEFGVASRIHYTHEIKHRHRHRKVFFLGRLGFLDMKTTYKTGFESHHVRFCNGF